MKPIRTGLIGAGYIASWHAEALRSTKGVDLMGVCDVNRSAAHELAQAYGVADFCSVAEMIAMGGCNAVHVLTPPHTHCAIAIECLQAGLHVLVEKPVGLNVSEAARVAEAASAAGRQVAVSHNFLGLPSYGRLKAVLDSGQLGRIISAEINWCFPLAPLRSGPFSLWLLQTPQNLLLELGPHLYAFAHDLFGPLEILHLELGMPIHVPGGGTRHQSWRIFARAGSVEITFVLSLVESFDDRSVTLRGSGGMARLDMGRDTLEIRRENASDIVLSPLIGELRLAWQHLQGGLSNASRQIASLNRKSPYGLSFYNLCASFYSSIQQGSPVDPRFSISSAADIMEAIGKTLDQLPSISAPVVATSEARHPSIMVIGGTGFLGRRLTRDLVAAGHEVRVLSRGNATPFADIADRVETVSVSLRDSEGLRRAMDGIQTVYNLAKSNDRTWEDALRNDVFVTTTIAEAAIDAKVERLIYTGTIASYDMSDPHVTITEATGFARDMSDRNIYARSKAECEARLIALQKDRGLPLIISRPGIVVGAGGPLQHWGIGRWNGPGAIRLWGDGLNILPFVLVEDVSDGLIRMMEKENAVGESFNLIGEPMLSARDYFNAIHEQLGARLVVKPGSLLSLYAMDVIKSALKRHVLGKSEASPASLRDWRSRGHLSRFANQNAKDLLGWQPEKDKDVFIEKAVRNANLFGF